MTHALTHYSKSSKPLLLSSLCHVNYPLCCIWLHLGKSSISTQPLLTEHLHSIFYELCLHLWGFFFNNSVLSSSFHQYHWKCSIPSLFVRYHPHMSLFLKLKCPVLGSFRLKLILAPSLCLEKFLTLRQIFHIMLDPA